MTDATAMTIRLGAQVREASSSHVVDPVGNILRRKGHPCKGAPFYLGDVAGALLYGRAVSTTIEVLEPPKMNEQKWKVRCRFNEIEINICSMPYWGLGLFTSGYLNIIEIDGPSESIWRMVYDLDSALGARAWEFSHPKSAEKMMKKYSIDSIQANREQWMQAIQKARKQVELELDTMVAHGKKIEMRLSDWLDSNEENEEATKRQTSFVEAESEVELAKRCLSDSNIPAFERALARAEAAFLLADPLHDSGEAELYSPDGETLRFEDSEVTFIDMSEDQEE